MDRLTPLPYQEADIKATIAAGGSALNTSDVGGRKTLYAVEVGLRMGTRVNLIIAPKGTHDRTWARTILRQDPTANVVFLGGDKKGKQAQMDLAFGEPGWYICTAQWFTRQNNWKTIKPDLTIVDEVHQFGNYFNKGRTKLHQLQSKHRIAMSGTPLRNKFENAWAIVRWVFPEFMPKTFYSWRLSDCETEYDAWAPQNRKVIGELEPGKLMNSLPCYIQHKQREHCCDFHPHGFMADLKEPIEEIRTVKMTAAQKKFYQNMEKNYVAWLNTPDPTTGELPVVAGLPIVARGMLRFCALGLPTLDPETNKLFFKDDCESPKLDELIQLLEEEIPGRVLVLVQSQKFARIVVNRLMARDIESFEWSGKLSQRARNVAMERFISGDLRVVVSVISAAGTGTDGFQEATNTEVWLGEDDDGTNNQQGRGRLDRPGQTDRVVRIRLMAEGTLDMGIMSKQLEAALKMSAQIKKKVAA